MTIYAETREMKARIDPDGVVRWDPPRLTADAVEADLDRLIASLSDRLDRARKVRAALALRNFASLLAPESKEKRP